jgi:hypothetical protein
MMGDVNKKTARNNRNRFSQLSLQIPMNAMKGMSE